MDKKPHPTPSADKESAEFKDKIFCRLSQLASAVSTAGLLAIYLVELTQKVDVMNAQEVSLVAHALLSLMNVQAVALCHSTTSPLLGVV